MDNMNSIENIENTEKHENEAAPEEDIRALLVGKNTEHYIPIFNDLDTTGGICWNWCGFFIAPVWFAYRKMYGWSVIAIIAPIVIPFIVGFIMAAEYASDSAMDLMSRVLSLGIAIVFGGVANRAYRKRIYRLAKEIPAEENARAEYIKRKGGVNVAAMIIVLVIYLAMCLVGAFLMMASMYQTHITY